ncbi:ABC transporter permease [Streptococcus dentapri]|uniref:ABC transporter permease n=1 Tax=Streptococcus dentapri TaxID=573564 RepID=A0ABV8D1V2_9STRE
MKEVFAKRRFDFNQQCLKYLRYVLNDHFILVLLFLLGFLLVQYSSLLQHFPNNRLPIILSLSTLILILLWFGRVATYLEPADYIFLLPKEDELLKLIRQARFRSFALWGSLQTALLIVLAPIFLALGFSKTAFFALLIGLLIVKALVVYARSRRLTAADHFDWDWAISYEQGRQQSILKFYSLFTNVKGISTQNKRRAYLDVFLSRLLKQQSNLWSNLYMRAYFRSGDYLGLTLRLTVLGILSLVFIDQALVASSLAVLFNYLLLFQLLALANHYDYQYLTQLFPVDADLKKRNFKSSLRKILYLILGLEVLVLLVFAFSWQSLLLLVVVSLVLNEVYLPYKLKNMIDAD